MNEKEELLISLFPENYRAALKSVSLSKLKTKYTIEGQKVQNVFNVSINIKASAYYPTGKSVVLCKLCDDKLFLPDTLEYAYISDLDRARSLIEKSIRTSCSTGSFGCCSKYNECSNARKCIHENPFYSLGCIYRSHLEAGQIYYGPNRNV